MDSNVGLVADLIVSIDKRIDLLGDTAESTAARLDEVSKNRQKLVTLRKKVEGNGDQASADLIQREIDLSDAHAETLKDAVDAAKARSEENQSLRQQLVTLRKKVEANAAEAAEDAPTEPGESA